MRKHKLIIIGLSLAAALPLHAQLFSPESVGGAAFGGLAGALIAGPHHAGTGAAIGAGTGFLLGAVAHEERRPYYYSPYYYPGPYYYGYYGPYRAYYYSPYGYPPAVTYYSSEQPTASQASATQANAEPAATTQAYTTYSSQPSSPMSSANALFGR